MFADFERIAGILSLLPEKKLAIAFSGGVDSMTLARAGEIALGKSNILLLFADSVFVPATEKKFALEWAHARQLECVSVPFAPLTIREVTDNGPRRCYFCKRELYTRLLQAAYQRNFSIMSDGENLDDAQDYRPGRQAANELKVRHILAEAQLTKAMIRDLAHDFALPNSQAPAAACLASRIPCHLPIKPELLQKVDRGEEILLNMGFAGARVRCYNDLAKIEVQIQDLEKIWSLRNVLQEKFHQIGFASIAIDPAGYRRGAVNGAEKSNL